MAQLPAQLHVKLDRQDHHKLGRLAKRARLTLSEVVRQLIRHAKLRPR